MLQAAFFNSLIFKLLEIFNTTVRLRLSNPFLLLSIIIFSNEIIYKKLSDGYERLTRIVKKSFHSLLILLFYNHNKLLKKTK